MARNEGQKIRGGKESEGEINKVVQRGKTKDDWKGIRNRNGNEKEGDTNEIRKVMERSGMRKGNVDIQRRDVHK